MARSWLIPSSLCVSIIIGATLVRYGLGAVRSKRLPDCNVRPRSTLPPNVPHEGTNNRVSPESSTDSMPSELILVSTLDGHVSALDPNSDGRLLWSHSTGDGALLSSSISQLEMSMNGDSIRLIPSLDGNLYKFDGKSVEAIPVSADTLLKNSFKLGDDAIITGGKESSSLGISLRTGQLRYLCETGGCQTFGASVGDDEDILVVRRLSQTVRAITPRSGGERWNFSVGEHEVTFLEKLEADCEGGKKSTLNGGLPFEEQHSKSTESSRIQVIVPDGLVISRDVSTDNKPVWSHKFESPIVHTWHLKGGQLDVIDLFEQKQVLALPNQSKSFAKPLLYLGRHHNQLYIQNSAYMKKHLHGALNSFGGQPQTNMPQIQWKPYAVTSPSRTPYINHGKSKFIADNAQEYSVVENPSTALVLKTADFLDYPYDSGYYLFGSIDLPNKSQQNDSCPKIKPLEDDVPEEDFNNNVIIVSFWHWWKEILGLAACLAIMINVFFTRHIVRKFKRKLLVETTSSSEIQIVAASTPSPSVITTSACEEAKADIFEIPVKDIALKVDKVNPLGNCQYLSRYLNDFEPIQRLGKGGFGVVFEARNKIDDCHYAVKRILLPARVEAQEKVMREVRALAKLDHTGIVRYFNAWQESPPPGWQQLHDQLWEDGQLQSGLSSLNGFTLSKINSVSEIGKNDVVGENAGAGDQARKYNFPILSIR